MRIERTHYRSWTEAYCCTIGPLELIVVTSIGPRISSLRLAGGENLLYEDDTDFKVGSWRLYGGHRFTTAPESEASYIPDNEPCEAMIEQGHLIIRQRASAGLQRCLEITSATERNQTLPPLGAPASVPAGPESCEHAGTDAGAPSKQGLSRGQGPIAPSTAGYSGFSLRHTLRNFDAVPWRGALWAITCVPRSGCVVAPCSQIQARLWTQPGAHYADASSPQWRSADDHFVVEPNGEKGKAGLCSEQGWLAQLRPDVTFIIRGPQRVSKAAYPDEGCNVEVYTCSRYLELETLGPMATLLPGQELSHEEQWQVVPQAFAPSAWKTIDGLARPRAGLVSPVVARGAAFGVPPSGGFSALPPEGGTPNQLPE